MTRNELELYPNFTGELEAIRETGITKEILQKIIQKHKPNSDYNRRLYNRYKAIYGGVPIFDRQPRYEEENPINNRINNEFFSEIVDFKTGYFAGEPISYSYSETDESEESTGGVQGVDKAAEALTDFTTRNNMFGVDMEITKNASIYGYSGRLFYIDKEGMERVMPVPGYETIILSDTKIAEPEYAIRYYEVSDINDTKQWIVEFYDDKNVTTYKGDLGSLTEIETRPHMFDYCPLQGIANNAERMGDAEKVLELIDGYDRAVSDCSNEIEAFVHALMVVGVNVDDEVVKKAQKSGVLIIPQVGSNVVNDPVKWVTKNIDDAFSEHHLQRLEDNIYRFSKTPNLNKDLFSSSSGKALKFRLHQLETKCAMFESCVTDAAIHMWRLLSSSWAKKGIKFDPLQVVMDFKRNFPTEVLENAQAAQALIAAGLSKKQAWAIAIPEVDDPDYAEEMANAEKEDNMALYEAAQQGFDNDESEDEQNNDKEEPERNNDKL